MSKNTVLVNDVSRRLFIKMAGAGGFGLFAGAVGCNGRPSGGDGWIPAQYEGQGQFLSQVRGRVPIDYSNPSICRDSAKCVLCGQCADVCEKTEAVFNHYELPLIEEAPCVHCGQCILNCPTGAIAETSDIERLIQALDDPNIHVVAQTAPATRVALGEEFGMKVGTNVQGAQVAALRALRVNTVFDTNFAADLTIMEEAEELVNRLTQDTGPIPMFTSCCPAWVKFCEYFHPELLPNLSTAKSPMEMLSVLSKTYFAKKEEIDPKNIFNVAIKPCTAKKFEATRHDTNFAVRREIKEEGVNATDIVLTTRELAQLLKMKGIDLNDFVDKDQPSEVKDEYKDEAKYNGLMGNFTGAGAIFGTTGGVMEAAVRTAYRFIAGKNPPDELLEYLNPQNPLEPIRGMQGIKSAKLDIPGFDGKVHVAVVTGLNYANEIIKKVKNGTEQYHFIEVMACPGGCICGGGQPKASLRPSEWVWETRKNALHTIDIKGGDILVDKKSIPIRLCHENPYIIELYDEKNGFLRDGRNGHTAHKFLHIGVPDEADPEKHNYYVDRSKKFRSKKDKNDVVET